MIRSKTARRAAILREKGAFEAVLRSGVRFAAPHFVVRARANEMEQPRLGIIAGRKAVPRALDRNRGKRLIREVFRAASAALGAYDVTVQMRSDLRDSDNPSIRAELGKLFELIARRGQTREPSGVRSETRAESNHQ